MGEKEVGRIESTYGKKLVVQYNKDRVILLIRKDTLRGEREEYFELEPSQVPIAINLLGEALKRQKEGSR